MRPVPYACVDGVVKFTVPYACIDGVVKFTVPYACIDGVVQFTVPYACIFKCVCLGAGATVYQMAFFISPHCVWSTLVLVRRICRNVQSLVEQGQKGELTMQPGKSMMESLESSINKVKLTDCPG